MGTFAKEILPINIEDEMRQSYLAYAMSVIVGRALPDVPRWFKTGSSTLVICDERTR